MRHFETVFILVPDLPDEERQAIVEKYKAVVVESGAEFLLLDDWGRRKLAYEIKRFNKGHYVLFEYASDGQVIAELERQLRLDDKVIRFLSIQVAAQFDRAAFEAKQAKPRTKPAEVDEAQPRLLDRERGRKPPRRGEGDLDEDESGDQSDDFDKDEEE